MKPVSYVAVGERTSPKWCAAFSRGCGGTVCDDGELRPGPIAMFGSPKLWGILTKARSEGRDWCYGDHGYFSRGIYFRITKNAFQHVWDGRHAGNASEDRLQSLGVEIRPWRSWGAHILVCPPDHDFAVLHGFSADEWLAETLAEIGRNTDRKIVLRGRRGIVARPRLSEDLKDCWAMVTHVSNAAVEAVVAGVPVICTGSCAASPMGTRDVARVEHPPMPDGREDWARSLAANQWDLLEIEAGKCWEAIGS